MNVPTATLIRFCMLSGIVGSFCLGQKQLQDVLQNRWGKYLAAVLGVNIIPPKALVVENLKKKKQELTKLIGLEFEVHGEVVIAKVNVAKYLEYLLSRPAVQFEKIAPKNKILFYQFTDLAPWLKWSRYFTGITTTRVKVVECQNLSRLAITAGVYLGPDDYETVKECFGELYKEYGDIYLIFLIGATGSQEKWVKALKQVARFERIENGHLIVKFDEIGVLHLIRRYLLLCLLLVLSTSPLMSFLHLLLG